MATKLNSNFSIPVNHDDFVVLIDHDDGMSVTNDANNVICWLSENLENGLGERQVYYRDTNGVFDELLHENGKFVSFKSCPTHVREALSVMVSKV